jgi:hypothetical protein
MRFDLLDEYSTLVPFGLGVSRKAVIQNPDVQGQEPASPAEVAQRSSCPGLLHKLSGAIRQLVSSSYRILVATRGS